MMTLYHATAAAFLALADAPPAEAAQPLTDPPPVVIQTTTREE